MNLGRNQWKALRWLPGSRGSNGMVTLPSLSLISKTTALPPTWGQCLTWNAAHGRDSSEIDGPDLKVTLHRNRLLNDRL